MPKWLNLFVIPLLVASCTPQLKDAHPAATSGHAVQSKCRFPDRDAILHDREKAKAQAAVYIRCSNAEARQLGLQEAKPVCLAKGLRDNTAAMSRCQFDEAKARCLRSVSEYRGYAMQMGSAGARALSAESFCGGVYK